MTELIEIVLYALVCPIVLPLIIEKEKMTSLTVEETETLITFVKNHEREDIPDDVWELITKLQEETDIW